jgi:TetR/AcrR family transcriptional regulator, cholesterol catabolism regulator
VPKLATTDAQRARRRRIVDAGMSLLRQRDYDHVQVKDVAEEAGVALGTVYHYFASKEHLFADVLVAWAATLGGNIARNPLPTDGDAARVAEVFRRSVRAFHRAPQFARLVAMLETSSDPYAIDAMARLGGATTPVYAAAMRDVEPATAQAIVRVLDAVLASGLRSWVTGHASIDDVYTRLDEAIGLLVTPR